jgi:RNA polymerase sigma-70 factor (ECF subfamily)
VSSDQILLAQTRAGNQEALGELLDRHYRHCVHVASSILRDRDDAQDAVQDAMGRALTRLDQYREEAPFSAWLMRIVVNYCLMRLRSRKRVRFISCDLDSGPDGWFPVQLKDHSSDPERQLIDDERYDMVEKEIQLLPPLFRSVVLLHDVYELPLADIAERLQISVGAIKGRLLRARHELKKRIADRYGRDQRLQNRLPGQGQTLTRSPVDHPVTGILEPRPQTTESGDTELEFSTKRRRAERPNRENQERRYQDEIPFSSVWPIVREQLAAGAGCEIQL